MQLILDRIKDKIRRHLYNIVFSKYGFGNRVSKTIWDRQFEEGFWNYLYHLEEEEHYNHIVELVKDINLSILDVGCGQGVLYTYLNKITTSFDYLGIDISERAVDLAQKQFPKARFKQLDYDYEKVGEKFDTIIFNETLYYFNRPLKTIEKCIRENLKEKGHVVISMCDFKGHDVIWKKLIDRYEFLNLRDIINEEGQKWKVGMFKP